MASKKIAVLVGSLRKDSYTRRVAHSLIESAPEGFELAIVELRDLPLYNEDDETDPPPGVFAAFRDAIGQADGVLFCTPEYNRSVPGALKNAIDVGSRPYGKAAFADKPCAIVSVSPGALGGFGANHHLRQMLPFLNMPTMPAPEAYVGGVASKYEGDKLVDESSRAFFQKFMAAFGAWVEQHAK
ncbi:NAD(P)H-dependent oxidoreductase [Massilia sp. CFBP9012]|uniref:NADPH-dependent FMN reductase n=1 Tax=Massilia sp. CFBP9012 TaxID=3096531 RepID=UPI002A6B2A02|nr:NAD(P)H-dependent oxidoreductase [Massilia sp. CFBP9012]MDY0977401.1 NAD(P)H-dependent oxidoreductase [Massilia sp. CFBP9012]